MNNQTEKQTVSNPLEHVVSGDFDNEEAYYVLKVSFDDYENKPWSEDFDVDNESEAKEKYSQLKQEYNHCSVNAHLVLEKTIYVDVEFN
jgi:hypothetical protein